jgi:hypothetical protein
MILELARVGIRAIRASNLCQSESTASTLKNLSLKSKRSARRKQLPFPSLPSLRISMQTYPASRHPLIYSVNNSNSNVPREMFQQFGSAPCLSPAKWIPSSHVSTRTMACYPIKLPDLTACRERPAAVDLHEFPCSGKTVNDARIIHDNV